MSDQQCSSSGCCSGEGEMVWSRNAGAQMRDAGCRVVHPFSQSSTPIATVSSLELDVAACLAEQLSSGFAAAAADHHSELTGPVADAGDVTDDAAASCFGSPSGISIAHRKGTSTSAAALVPATAALQRRTVVHRRKNRHDLAGPCNHCGALTSPQWRKGPKGKPVLCNACGIRFLRSRSLTKVAPKKRRQAGTAGGSCKRSSTGSAAAGEAEEGTDDQQEAAHAATDAALLYHQHQHQQQQQEHAASMSGMHMGQLTSAQQAFFLQHANMLYQQHQQQGQGEPGGSSGIAAAFAAAAVMHGMEDGAAAAAVAALQPTARDHLLTSSDMSVPALFMPAPAAPQHNAAADAGRAGADAAAAAAAASRQQLLKARCSRSLLDQLGDCPSLAIALTRHQLQQQQQQHYRPAGETRAVTLPKPPQLQLVPPGSPHSDSVVTCFANAAVAAAAASAAGGASPLSSTSSLQYQQLQLQSSVCRYSSSVSPPLSPLMLGAAGSCNSALATAPTVSSCLGGNGNFGAVLPARGGDRRQQQQHHHYSHPGVAAAAAAAAAGSAQRVGVPQEASQQADILQLVQQLGASLGGVAPAVEFLKLCSGSPAAVAAAVAAVGSSTAAR